MNTRRLLSLFTICSFVALGCNKQNGPVVPPDEAAAQPQPEPAPQPEQDTAPEPSDLETVIRSTVLVATKWGHGTGVFVDESGLVLTNYHVVASGKNEEYGIDATVTLAELGEDGSVTPGEHFSAVAYKVDEDHDLALLKVDNPDGRKFPTVHVAVGDPKPGSKVSSIGNAGVGFGWAVKQCAINAIGTMESFASVIFQEQREDPMAEEVRKQVAEQAKKQGKQIQTDCNVLPGDSGGPLVDVENNHLVGLNVAIRSATSGWATLGSVAFHIHVGEIRNFLSDTPDKPKLFVPDPWEVAGTYGRFGDTSQDGEIDTLRYEGQCGDMLRCVVTFTDIDQSSYRKTKGALPSPTDVKTDRSFDAELAVVEMGRYPRKKTASMMPVSDRMVFVDTNRKNKGFDRMLVRDGETGKTRGYKLVDGVAERDTSLDGTPLGEVSALFPKKGSKRRGPIIEAAVAEEQLEPRNPGRARAVEADARDVDGDGKLDTVRAKTRLDTRLIVDLEQKRFERSLKKIEKKLDAGKFKEGTTAEGRLDWLVRKRLRRGRLKGNFLAVIGTPARVFYDTNSDGKYDLELQGESLYAGVAVQAHTLEPDGKRTPANEHLGRRLLRPGLIESSEQAGRLQKIITEELPGYPVADLEDGASSFPMPQFDRAATAQEVPNSQRSLMAVLQSGGLSILADLDGNTFRGKSAKLTNLEAVQKGKFDAELVLHYVRGLSWAFYDRDDNGSFDLILVSDPSAPQDAGSAFELSRSGKLTRRPDLEGKPMLQEDLFKKKKIQKGFATARDRLRSVAM
jgi:hypothetical protein